MYKTPRRSFLKQLALTSATVVGFPSILSATHQKESAPLADMKTILFQGDSITDAGRNKKLEAANNSRAAGFGYVNLIQAELLGKKAEVGYQIYNRGISGHKVFQLAKRWQKDCLDIKPDLLSILIGVNDFWHTLTHDYQGTAETYATDLRALLNRTRAELPNLKLIIAEPFSLKGGTAIKADKWYPAFEAYQEASQKIAQDFDAVFIPYQSIFDKALEKAPVSYWCPDGVHPSPAGNYLMAKAWLKAFKKVK